MLRDLAWLVSAYLGGSLPVVLWLLWQQRRAPLDKELWESGEPGARLPSDQDSGQDRRQP